MTTENLPEPMVPAHVDLRGLLWMPLHVTQLLDSDLFALTTGDEFKAAVALWGKSWHQVPGGSLPADDRVLAHLSSTGPAWPMLREVAMRGWVKCSDGRLYHRVIAEAAIKAYDERIKFQAKQEKKREGLKVWRETKREKGLLGKNGGLRKPASGDVPQGTEVSTEVTSSSTSQVNEITLQAVSSGHEGTSEVPSKATSNPQRSASEVSKTGTGTGKESIGGSGDTAESVIFVQAWSVYPKRVGDNPRRMAHRCWSARLKDGCTEAQMLEGVKRYAAFCRAAGKVGTEFVMQATRFFGPDKPFSNDWVYTPPPTRPGGAAANPETDQPWLDLRSALRRGVAPAEPVLFEAYRAIGGSRLLEMNSKDIDDKRGAFDVAWLKAKSNNSPRVQQLVASIVKTA